MQNGARGNRLGGWIALPIGPIAGLAQCLAKSLQRGKNHTDGARRDPRRGQGAVSEELERCRGEPAGLFGVVPR